MKKILIILVLFSSLIGCERNYIKDFKIEGIALGDSLLDKYTKEEILEYQRDYYPETQFIESDFFSTVSNFVYEQISAGYKRGDNKFIVEAISGNILYEKNIEDCYPKKEEVVKNLSEVLKITDWEISNFTENLGSYDMEYIVLESGVNVTVSCYDWNKETETDLGWSDHLSVQISSKEWEEMIENN